MVVNPESKKSALLGEFFKITHIISNNLPEKEPKAREAWNSELNKLQNEFSKALGFFLEFADPNALYTIANRRFREVVPKKSAQTDAQTHRQIDKRTHILRLNEIRTRPIMLIIIYFNFV